MKIVSTVYASAQSQLSALGEAQFNAIASAVGLTLQSAAVLALALTFLNMIFQMRPMELGNFTVLIVKILLIFQFATVWGQFHTVVQIVVGTMDRLSALMVGGDGEAASLAAKFDLMMSNVSVATNAALTNIGSWGIGNWMLSVLVTLLLGIIGALASLIIIYGILMITIHIALAPIFIGLSIFEATKDYFHKWLASTVSYALYPVVIGAVLGLISKFVENMISRTSASSVTSIADFVPFVVILLMLIASIVLIPSIVAGLSGNLQAISPLAAVAMGSAMARSLMTVGRGAASAASVVGGAARGAVSGAEKLESLARPGTVTAGDFLNCNTVEQAMKRNKKYEP